VVIASLCDDARETLLKRACDSVRVAAGDHDYSIIVVANGARVKPSVLDWLASRSDVRVIRLRSSSHPLARRVGAEMADGEFLAFLDDDDELMPGTLVRKVAYFREHPEVDVLFTDGLRVNGSTVTNIFPPAAARRADLVETMMRTGWGACALTLRTQNIDLSALDAELGHMEWTLTTLELVRRYKFGFLDEPTYRYNEDTPNSVSKRAEHHLAAPEVWRRLSRSYAGTRYEALVRRRYGTVCHHVARECARRGHMRDAWRLHAESLQSPRGLAYVPFSATLLLASLRSLLAFGRFKRASSEREPS
jgi:glycosyltransferase involved in cell wall biosynthesis